MSDNLKTSITMEPKQLISLEKAKELNENYNETRARLHQEKMGKEDANAVWYSLEELENYIAYVKKQGAEKGYVVDGIRLYMGVYSTTEAESKAGYSTIFLAPTGQQSKGGSQQKSATNKEGSPDILEINAMNFGSMGNPPKLKYGG